MTPRKALDRNGTWLAILALAVVLFLALTFRVNAVRSEVHRLERQIVQVERERLLLETEYETRASQRQLSDWNEVDFGYLAPTGSQYVEGHTQLASLGASAPASAPAPVRLARNTPLPASGGALAGFARVLESDTVDQGRDHFSRAVAVLDGEDDAPTAPRTARVNADTVRLAQRLTRGAGRDDVLSGRLVRSGQ